MANATDTMRFLTQAFDIAPCGTREEGEAAQTLANAFHEHGLESAIATFMFSNIAKYVPAACALLIALFGVIAGFARGALPVVMLVLILLVGAVYVLESMGIHTVTRFGPQGASQNVIARHPAVVGAGAKGTRPVVIIAHYDTPHADLLSSPAVARFKPYVSAAVKICLITVAVCVLIEVFPIPTVLHSIVWAITLVAAIILIAWGVCELVSILALPETEGANDNKSSIAALLGVLDRVRPVRGGVAYDELLPSEGVQDSRSQTGLGTPVGAAAPVREKKPVRHGADVIRSLGVVADSCELVYESEEPRAASAPAPKGSVHLASAANAIETSQIVIGETQFIPRDQIAAAAQIPAVLLGSTSAAVVPEPLDPEAAKDQATEAIMANIVGTSVPNGSDVPAVQPVEPAAEQTVAVNPSFFAGGQGIEGDPLPDGATMLMQPVGGAGLQLPDWEPAKQQPFHVITERDESDVELRYATGELPPDVTGQSAASATSSFSAVEPSDQAAAMVSSDDWGTSSFQPVSAAHRILGEDLPDPAVAAIDPYSVTTIETSAEYNPDDFSQIDFETGTHEAVTPAMLEEVQRRNLDGFTADFTEKGSRKSRKSRKSRSGRISHQAAQMQAEMEEQSFTDWMGLDEDFDAKKNGRQIGSWDNFESDEGTQRNDPYTQWKGGATRRSRRAGGEAVLDDEERRQARQAAMTLGDRDLVAHEIWFVLTGASNAGNAGVRDFMDKYRNELRGAYIVNLECVGAGVQSLILEEGSLRRARADRRLVNLFGEASAAINRPLALDRMEWRDTDATVALQQNCRAVTVCGLQDGVPANARTMDDVVESINPNQIDDLVDIVVEVIKNA